MGYLDILITAIIDNQVDTESTFVLPILKLAVVQRSLALQVPPLILRQFLA
jgi:hypothetical protein